MIGGLPDSPNTQCMVSVIPCQLGVNQSEAALVGPAVRKAHPYDAARVVAEAQEHRRRDDCEGGAGVHEGFYHLAAVFRCRVQSYRMCECAHRQSPIDIIAQSGTRSRFLLGRCGGDPDHLGAVFVERDAVEVAVEVQYLVAAGLEQVVYLPAVRVAKLEVAVDAPVDRSPVVQPLDDEAGRYGLAVVVEVAQVPEDRSWRRCPGR